jgi:hypothetical protein
VGQNVFVKTYSKVHLKSELGGENEDIMKIILNKFAAFIFFPDASVM